MATAYLRQGLRTDLYGTHRPISDGTTFADRVARFHLVFNFLAQKKQRTPAEAADTLGIVQQQVDAVNEAIQEQKDPWNVYPILPNVHRIRTDFEFW